MSELTGFDVLRETIKRVGVEKTLFCEDETILPGVAKIWLATEDYVELSKDLNQNKNYTNTFGKDLEAFERNEK